MAIIPAATDSDIELEVTTLAAGGDGVARDANGRVTFVPRSVPGDRVLVRIVKQTASFARAEIVSIVSPSPARVEPVCDAFVRGCGGCAWLHVMRGAQLEAKQAIVLGALRKLDNLAVEHIADPAPALGWRRRARFHVHAGKLGLYRADSRDVVPLSHCPQLDPALDAALIAIAPLTPPDGELALALGYRGEIVVGVERAWRGAASLVGRAGIIGVVAGQESFGTVTIEVEPGLSGGPWDFAQASAAGNAKLIALARGALGPGPGTLLELYAGSGNLTRGFTEDGWTVTSSDIADERGGSAEQVLAKLPKGFDALVLDPPRGGAADAIDGIARHAPRTIIYISCDPATLGRDAARLVASGYRAERAWPMDLMPQTAHVEVVLKLTRSATF